MGEVAGRGSGDSKSLFLSLQNTQEDIPEAGESSRWHQNVGVFFKSLLSFFYSIFFFQILIARSCSYELANVLY